GVINGHRENVINIFTLKSYFQHLFFETFAITGIAEQMNIGHKLHLDGNFTFAFAGFTAAAIYVETEMLCFVAVYVRKFLRGIQIPNIIISLNIGYGIATAGAANWILINKFDTFNGPKIAFYF